MKANGVVAVIGAILLTVASAGYGSTFSDVNVDYWTGSGSNTAMLVVDFGAGSSYAFGYRFDGVKSSWDMIQDITANGGLDMTYTIWPFGASLDSLSYGTHTATSDWFYTFLGYWTSDNGDALTPSLIGMADRVLADGSLDGWSVESVASGYDPINAPIVPVSVPEPATLSLLGMGLVALLKKKSARRAA